MAECLMQRTGAEYPFALELLVVSVQFSGLPRVRARVVGEMAEIRSSVFQFTFGNSRND